MGGLRIRRALVGVMKETTAFQYLEPDASNSYPAFDIEVNFDGDNFQRKDVGMHYGKPLEIPGPATGTISFKVCAVGGTAVATAPYYANALLACGFQQGITAGTQVDYKPWSTFDAGTAAGPPATTNPFNAYTIAVWEDGIQYALKGATGKAKLTAKMGEPVVWEFSFQGAYVAQAADTFPAVTPTTLSPAAFLGATLLLHTFAAVFTEFEMDMGNELGFSENANDAAGIKGSVMTDRRIVCRLNPEQELPATKDFLALWRAGTAGALTWGPINTGTGNRISFSASNVQLRAPKFGDRNSIRTLDIELPVVTTGAEGSDFFVRYT